MKNSFAKQPEMLGTMHFLKGKSEKSLELLYPVGKHIGIRALKEQSMRFI